MNILEVKGLEKLYVNKKDIRGIKNLNFSIKDNAFHAFIGENGAGKTTTIKCIIGSYFKYKGSIYIFGKNHNLPESKQIIGYVPEYATFPKDMTTYSYLKSLAKLNKISSKDIENKIDSYLTKFNITDLKNQKPSQMSSGQKKKILLIQALIHDPKLIILDEPAANLDPTARYELFEVLKQLHKEGKTILISSHVLAEIDKYTTSLTLIHKGEVIYSGNKIESLEKTYYEKVIKN
ncbi:ABC transporter ATP-binding protein [Mycoplasmopsis maculosa]|uniref:ABC transporter ATP-binding protein n=1 Tax=Mycoplasmopsis maculosa TaxID=114885 RepID=A0A449B4U4_9BACT|nr:ABC transporter ATP-binding protein [Mycoplasmopsis maculosa]VEU75627.1 ABC transporter ATP-binding protein [Mycoplasmopsis maculosa]